MVMMLLRIMVRAPLMLVGSLIMAIAHQPAIGHALPGPDPDRAARHRLDHQQGLSAMFSEVQRRLDALNTVMQENLAGVRVVKAFVRAATR